MHMCGRAENKPQLLADAVRSTCWSPTPKTTCAITVFLLILEKGWRLSDAFDMNPVAGAHDLKLNISEADNAMGIELARSIAPYFRLSTLDANAIVVRQQVIVGQWPMIAASLKIPVGERQQVADAFRRAWF